MQVTESTITAGAAGGITADAGSDARVGVAFSGSATVTLGSGGAGIYNTGDGMQVTESTITAGASGGISATSTSSDARVGYAELGASATVTLGSGGAGIYNTGDGMQVTESTITAGAAGGITATSTSDDRVGVAF